jgi:hypothetical protein
MPSCDQNLFTTSKKKLRAIESEEEAKKKHFRAITLSNKN